MKKVAVLQAEHLEIRTFVLGDVVEDETMKLSKRDIRMIADSLELKYHAKEIEFSKKILNAYIQSGK